MAVLIAGWALWVRRDCWRSEWERAANTAIVLQITALLLLVPQGDNPVCTSLYLLTDDGWMDDFVAHCFYVWSVACIGYHIATRLTGVAPQFKRRAIVAIIPLTGMRLGLIATHHYTLYWVLLCLTGIGWLLWTLSMMAELWADPKHRRTLTAYVLAVSVAAVTSIAQMLLAAQGQSSIEIAAPVWVGCCVTTIGFSAGFAYSWQRRKRVFRPAALAY